MNIFNYSRIYHLGERLVLYIIFGVVFPVSIYARGELSNSKESFAVSIDFGSSGQKNFTALYSEDGHIYFPIKDIFNYLKIENKMIQGQTGISGYLQGEQDVYEINTNKQIINYQGQTTPLPPTDWVDDQGQLYIVKEKLEKSFGFKIQFDFRSLTAKMSGKQEFPLANILKTSKARENLRRVNSIEVFDSILSRRYHWFQFGMADWSITANKMFRYTDEANAGLGLGAELLGGETDIWLNYSDRYGFQRNQQRYQWKWVDNNFSLFRQVQFGRIYTNSISTLLSPIDGFIITNTPSTVRKALGEYIISDHTNPEWIVELYINNTLVDYVKSDASGFYSFKVPIVYGTNQITLRFYGPNGEERSQEKVMNMPYNMLPIGKMEYRITGGSMLDTVHSRYARAEVSYGLSHWMTLGGGYEYLSSILSRPDIPFGNLTLQPLPRLILTGEYAYGVRSKAALNYNFNNNSFDINYIWYASGQHAILYNYRKQLNANLSVPFRSKYFSGVSRLAYHQNKFENFSYNTGELTLSAFSGRASANLQNLANWTDNGSTSNIYSNLTLSYRFWGNTSIRPSIQYNYSMNQVMSYKTEIEKQISKKGYLSMVYENSPAFKYSSFNVALKFDLAFMSTYLSSYFSNNSTQLAFSARGGTAFGSSNHYVYTDSHEMVGRSGISLIGFVDTNFNGEKDVDEPYVSRIIARCSGGKVIYSTTDSVTRIVSLEPFVDYTIHLDESSFENIGWKVATKTMKVTTDPNQFKKILVAIQPMAEISGVVKFENEESGVSRILVNVIDNNGKVVTKMVTESDGYFSYLGLKPGNYRIMVDSIQQKVIGVTCEAIPISIKPNAQGDSKTIDIMMHRVISPETKNNLDALNTHIENEDLSPDSLLMYVVLFDLGKTSIKTEYRGSLMKLAQLLNENKSIKLQIEGHSDSNGKRAYNMKISQIRAENVMKAMIALGVNEQRLRTQWYGDTEPVATNETATGRAKNRRVIFKSMTSVKINGNGAQAPIVNQSYISQQHGVEFSNDTSTVWLNTQNMYSIFFAKDQYTLHIQHQVLLGTIAEVMQAHPDVNLLVSGYADSDGSYEYNKSLTDNRVKQALDYLRSKGVLSNRISSKSYGKTRPFNENQTNDEKLLNRRVLFSYYKNGHEVNMDKWLFTAMKNNIKSNVQQLFICKENGKYLIQAGAYQSEEQAKKVAKRLSSLFADNIYVINEGGLYKIRIGYLKNLSDALKTRTFIQASRVLEKI